LLNALVLLFLEDVDNENNHRYYSCNVQSLLMIFQ